jgi:hypothetical protein
VRTAKSPAELGEAIAGLLNVRAKARAAATHIGARPAAMLGKAAKKKPRRKPAKTKPAAKGKRLPAKKKSATKRKQVPKKKAARRPARKK